MNKVHRETERRLHNRLARLLAAFGSYVGAGAVLLNLETKAAPNGYRLFEAISNLEGWGIPVCAAGSLTRSFYPRPVSCQSNTRISRGPFKDLEDGRPVPGDVHMDDVRGHVVLYQQEIHYNLTTMVVTVLCAVI